MTPVAAREHIDTACALWQRRSSRTCDLDLSILTDAGVTVRRPPEATARHDVAARTLTAQTRGRQLMTASSAPFTPAPSAPPTTIRPARPAVAVSPPASGFWRRLFRRSRRRADQWTDPGEWRAGVVDGRAADKIDQDVGSARAACRAGWLLRSGQVRRLPTGHRGTTGAARASDTDAKRIRETIAQGVRTLLQAPS